MKTCLLVLLFTLSCMYCHGQQDSAVQKLYSFVQNVDTFNNLYPQEKVYLHFDNTGYFLGETIWFKAYVTQAETNGLTALSKVLYTELLSPEGSIVFSKKYEIDNGTARGEFLLPDSLFAGYYEVRAYTRGMLNWGEDVVFSRVFPVFDEMKTEGDYESKRMSVRDKRKSVPMLRGKADRKSVINIEFYPEGGSLIAGINNRVAYKATDKNRCGLDVSGTVYDDLNNEVANFTTFHQGMGFFDILPSSTGKKYYVQIEYDGKSTKADLPEIKNSGYAMSVNNMRPDNMLVHVEKTQDIAPQELGLAISCRGKVYAFIGFRMESQSSEVRIPKQDIPSGVVVVTLFDSMGQIIIDRMVFINQRNENFVFLKYSNSSLNPFQAVNLHMSAFGHNNQPVETSFSLSVRDKRSLVGTNYSDDIRTYMLLSSELKGYIENPSYYFENDDIRHRTALDLLMMVQGWRRYDWNQMAGLEPFTVKYGIEHSLIIEGHATSGFLESKPLENADIRMWMFDASNGNSRQGKCETDKEGKFNFDLDSICGKWELNLQAIVRGKPEISSIMLDRNISPRARPLHYYETNLPRTKEEKNGTQMDRDEFLVEITNPKGLTRVRNELEPSDDSIKSHLLKEVVITENKSFKMEDIGLRYANIQYNILEEEDKMIDSNEDYNENLMDFLSRINPYFNSPSGNSGQYKLKAIKFIVDNIDIDKTSWRNIRNILVGNVDKIMISEVDNLSMFISGNVSRYLPKQDSIVVFIYTNKDGKYRTKVRRIRKTYFEGYNRPREFYNPDYNYNHLPEIKDFRRTLYWNPDVKTSKDGQTTIKFYNNSNCKEIDVSIEGIDKNGRVVVLGK